MLYQRGWHGLTALPYMLEDLDELTLYRDYTATMQRHAANMLGSRWVEEWQPLPSYLDMAHPKQKKPEPKQESIEESKAHVYEIFGITPPERG